jgi:Fic family protein
MISAPQFYISGFLEENKDLYISTMRRVSSHGDWNGWCAFFLEAVEKQAISNLTIAEKIARLYEDMKGLFSDTLSSKWAVAALDFIFTYPVFRNNKFTSNGGIPSGTAARFTRVLLERNLLQTLQEASGRRPALYSFTPLMELVRV